MTGPVVVALLFVVVLSERGRPRLGGHRRPGIYNWVGIVASGALVGVCAWWVATMVVW